jgi:hypothetical protein
VSASPLVEEATRRSGLVWVRPDGADRACPVWHAWHDGCAWLVVGGSEQDPPGLADAGRAQVLVRSHERRSGLLVTWTAEVERVLPGTPEWEQGVPALHAARLNAADGEQQPQRWARESTVLRLRPTGQERVPPPADDEEEGPPAQGIVMPPSTGSVTPVT